MIGMMYAIVLSTTSNKKDCMNYLAKQTQDRKWVLYENISKTLYIVCHHKFNTQQEAMNWALVLINRN
jgi:hypothetical protein